MGQSTGIGLVILMGSSVAWLIVADADFVGLRGGRCLCHSKPHKFDMTTQLIIGSMADLMVREIWGAYEHAHRQRIMQLIRVVECYSEPLLFVEASQTQPWRLLHLNDAAISTTGK